VTWLLVSLFQHLAAIMGFPGQVGTSLAFVGLRGMDKNVKTSMNQTRDF